MRSFPHLGAGGIGMILAACADAPHVIRSGPTGADCPGAASTAASTWLCVIGDRGAMLDRGDLSAAVRLADLPDDANLIAVGPVEGLRGEVTVYGGQAFVSTMRGGRQILLARDEAEAVGAVFLAFGNTADWHAVRTDRALDGLAAVEAFVLGAAAATGLPTGPGAAFPFRIEGTPDRLRYHVIFRSDESEGHDRAMHSRSKVPFEADDRPSRIAGVLVAERDVGRVTHSGQRTHLHAIVGDHGAPPQGAGHVDDLRLPEGTVLLLPNP